MGPQSFTPPGKSLPNSGLSRRATMRLHAADQSELRTRSRNCGNDSTVRDDWCDREQSSRTKRKIMTIITKMPEAKSSKKFVPLQRGAVGGVVGQALAQCRVAVRGQ